MAITDELRAALGAVTGSATGRASRQAQVGGLVFLPLLGAAIGLLAGAAASLAAPLGRLPAAVAALLVVAAASRGQTLRGVAAAGGGGVAGAGAVLALALPAAWAVAAIPDGGRTIALALACMLGRWAVVVQSYGGTPPAGEGFAAQVVGRARLREFGWASAAAFGATLVLLDAIGLVVLLAATLATIGLRVVGYRRRGAIDDAWLATTTAVVETVALLVLAALAHR